MSEFEYKGVRYTVGKLDLMNQQLHIMRKIGKKVSFYADFRDPSSRVMMNLPLLLLLSGLPDEDASYVIKTCLSVIQRFEGQGWSKITAPNGSLMYESMDVQDILWLTGQVLESHFASFFAELRQGIPEPSAKGETSNG